MTKSQKTKLFSALKQYKKKYLTKKYADLDESATRLMINAFLTEVLGYTELDEVKTEFAIRGTYADYVIQIEHKKHFIVEVKAIQIDLSENHIRQAVNYAANEGVDWVLLTNGRQFKLFKVIFSKPISYKQVFFFDFNDDGHIKDSVEYLSLLCKKAILKDELGDFWKRFSALEPIQLCKYLYAKEVVHFLKRSLKKKTGLNFSEEDIFDSVHQIIITRIPSIKPKYHSSTPKADRKEEKEITLEPAQAQNPTNTQPTQ